MSDIVASSLAVRQDTSILALKLQTQRDQQVVSLVQEATQSAAQSLSSGSASGNGQLVDIIV